MGSLIPREFHGVTPSFPRVTPTFPRGYPEFSSGLRHLVRGAGRRLPDQPLYRRLQGTPHSHSTLEAELDLSISHLFLDCLQSLLPHSRGLSRHDSPNLECVSPRSE